MCVCLCGWVACIELADSQGNLRAVPLASFVNTSTYLHMPCILGFSVPSHYSQSSQLFKRDLY